ncbi:hypothetical protein EDC04DRAFT_982544 [Pisolithus marmoratus]|nr:hypothetical protein EDC04DRAFT_982544 [Pisolithus marmoratus]
MPNLERQQKTLYWLVYHLRLIMHQPCILHRSTYLPAYSYLIHLPYSGSIPMSPETSFNCPTRLHTVQRGTRVLDIFTDASELYLGRCKLFKDLFDLMQPRSHIESLCRHYGMGEGLVHVTSPVQSVHPPPRPSTAWPADLTGRRIRTSILFAAIAVAASNNPPCPDLDADI